MAAADVAMATNDSRLYYQDYCKPRQLALANEQVYRETIFGFEGVVFSSNGTCA